MTLKRIDETAEGVTGFSYINLSGEEEWVSTPSSDSARAVCRIYLATCERVAVYKQDIPNLIKALQAAYDNKEG